MKKPSKAAKQTAVGSSLPWRTKREGKPIGAYHVTLSGGKRVNLRTQDYEAAKARRREAMAGRHAFTPDASMQRARSTDEGSGTTEGAADALLAALDGAKSAHPKEEDPPSPAIPFVAEDGRGQDAPSGESRGTPAAAGSAEPAAAGAIPELVNAERIEPGDWTADVRSAAAPTPEQPTPPKLDPMIGNEELAKLGVEAQLWTATFYARQKVWKGFIPPNVPQEARSPLVEQWTKILAYCDIASQLPPWVMGLAVPISSLLFATVAMAQGFSELARQQRKEAGEEPPPQHAAPEAAAPAA